MLLDLFLSGLYFKCNSMCCFTGGDGCLQRVPSAYDWWVVPITDRYVGGACQSSIHINAKPLVSQQRLKDMNNIIHISPSFQWCGWSNLPQDPVPQSTKLDWRTWAVIASLASWTAWRRSSERGVLSLLLLSSATCDLKNLVLRFVGFSLIIL